MQVQELFNYEQDGSLLWKVSCAQRVRQGMVAGGIQNHPSGKRWQVKIHYRLYLRARLVWIYHYGAIPESLTVIHLDKNAMNDRIENLALVNKDNHFKRIGGTRKAVKAAIDAGKA